MRSIKFRAWDKENKTMWFNVQNAYDMQHHGKEENSKGLDMSLYPSSFQSVLEDETLIVMQSTGLTDKDGKEIYEGDVLGGFWESGFIKWCNKCKSLQYSACDFCFACEGDVHWYELVEDDGKLEVIGNVHENPELLETV